MRPTHFESEERRKRREGERAGREGGKEGRAYLDGNRSAEFQPHSSCDVIAFTPTLCTQRGGGRGRGREGRGGRDLNLPLVIHVDVREEARARKGRIFVIDTVNIGEKNHLEGGREGGRVGGIGENS